MKIEFHRSKSQRNKSLRGFGLEYVETMDWETAITVADTRRDYGEPRFITYGMIETRLYVLVWTPRGEVKRVISLRKANEKERKRYEKA